MQILSAQSGGEWFSLEPEPISENEEEQARICKNNQRVKDEVRRVLSDCFRCNNLVVLTGLGTSLYVNVDSSAHTRQTQTGKRIAPMMWDLWKKAEEKAGDKFEHVRMLARYTGERNTNIEALLSHCKTAHDFLTNGRNKKLIEKFVTDTEKIIRDAVDFLEDDNEVPYHVELLRRIARRSNRKSRTKLFTTNYDLCFEQAARRGRYIIIDGFSHTVPAIFDSTFFSYDIVRREGGAETLIPIENVFHLYKLHGSIDWMRNEETGEIEKRKTDKPLLVYPRKTKYELAFEQPYFEMMTALQAALREPQTGLLVMGFGFNDNHIAEPVLSAIRSNQHLNVVICDPALVPAPNGRNAAITNPHLNKIRKLILGGDERLALINVGFEKIVDSIPDIAAETELERHMQRIRNMQRSTD
jgi:hypothetical protein